MVFYIGGYFVPMLTQLMLHQDSYKLFMLYLALLTQIVFFAFELVQVRHLGPKEYFKDYWNIIDIANFFIYIFYFYLRLPYDKSTLPDLTKNVNEDSEGILTWVWINTFLITHSFVKVIGFFRVFTEFGHLVQLINRVARDLFAFMVFFFIWIFFFSLIHIVAGLKFNDDDYKNLNPMVIYPIVIFRNSLGDISVPNNEYWMFEDSDRTLMTN